MPCTHVQNKDQIKYICMNFLLKSEFWERLEQKCLWKMLFPYPFIGTGMKKKRVNNFVQGFLWSAHQWSPERFQKCLNSLLTQLICPLLSYSLASGGCLWSGRIFERFFIYCLLVCDFAYLHSSAGAQAEQRSPYFTWCCNEALSY